MNKVFVFAYTRLNIISGDLTLQHNTINSKDELVAQIQMLMFLNKCNKESFGRFQYYAASLHPV